MLAHRLQVTWVALFLASLGSPELGWADLPSQTSKSRIEAALQNVMTLERPGQDGFATIWDGNKYVQCGRARDRSLRCEAAGTLMQPSLDHVLTRNVSAGSRRSAGASIRVSAIMCRASRLILRRARSRTKFCRCSPRHTTPRSPAWRSKASGSPARLARHATARHRTSRE